MKSFKILVAASVLALSATSALAVDDTQYGSWGGQSSQSDGGIGSHILNNQINLQNNWSNLNSTVDTVGGNVVGQSAAAGNLIDITTMNNTRVQNSQIVGPTPPSARTSMIDATNVWGNVGIQNQVVCNGASVSTDPVLTQVNSNQECHAVDPYSQIKTNISNVAGNAVIQGSALGNSFEADSNAPNMPIMSHQLNDSSVVSNVNANIFNAGGSVGLSSSAIGNTSQIIHYNTN